MCRLQSWQDYLASDWDRKHSEGLHSQCVTRTVRMQAPEDDPTAHIVSGPSSSVPPSARPSPTPSQIELSKVQILRV